MNYFIYFYFYYLFLFYFCFYFYFYFYRFFCLSRSFGGQTIWALPRRLLFFGRCGFAPKLESPEGGDSWRTLRRVAVFATCGWVAGLRVVSLGIPPLRSEGRPPRSGTSPIVVCFRDE